VRYLLEGSVRQSGSRVRISGHLIDVTTAAHIWAETFDREMADLFQLQDEITEYVVNAIEPAMQRSEAGRIVRKNPTDLSAFDFFQRGMWHFNKMTIEGYHEAIALFRQCIARDPEMSVGHIGVARSLYNGVTYGWSSEPELDMAQAQEAARIAIGLDPRDAYAHSALSGVDLYLGSHREALEEARKAISLNPNFEYGHFRLGQVLTYFGRPAEAVTPIERSMRHSPFDPQLGAMIAQLALAHYHAGNYAESALKARTAAHLKYMRGYAVLAASLARLGRPDEARDALEAYLPELRQQTASRTLRLVPYANPADRDDLFQGLRLAGLSADLLNRPG
jgi:adenylate cyclase